MYIIKATIDSTTHSAKVSITLINKGRLNKPINPPEIINNTIKSITAKKSGKNFSIVCNLKG